MITENMKKIKIVSAARTSGVGSGVGAGSGSEVGSGVGCQNVHCENETLEES